MDDIADWIKKTVKDLDLMGKIRVGLDGQLLKETTLNNWRRTDSSRTIPQTALDGFALGAYYQEIGAGTPLSQVPQPLLQLRQGDILATGMYAETVWHILTLKKPANPGDGTEGEILHFWENVRTLPGVALPVGKPTTDALWLLHAMRGEEHALFRNAQALGDDGVLDGRKPFAGFQEEIGDNVRNTPLENRVVYKREIIPQESGAVSFGYRFEAIRTFRHALEPEVPSEFFGSQAMIPCLREYVLVCLPEEYVDYSPFEQYVTSKTFTPTDPNSVVEFVQKVLTKGFRKDQTVDPSLFATWWEAERVDRVTRAPDLRLPEALRGLEAELFGPRRFVFRAERTAPNPLTYQMIFWKLPPSRSLGTGSH